MRWLLCLAAALAISSVAQAAELIDRDPPTHRSTVCQPGKECEWRGRTKAKTACDLDLASDQLQANLPAGTVLTCVPIAGRR